MDKLKKLLVKYGDILILKDGYVFTLFMTGEELSKWNTVAEIERAVFYYCKDRFPIVEVMRNDKNYFLIVLKPR